ncbi:MAG TPA: tripartite tricarboxylate transporter substrate binding protein [Burkholderiales bacterium]|nr:tripartite tricarboxylate transporter substrate binding protein [Burkholderiales bacterium]
MHRSLTRALCAVALAALAVPAFGQSYPTRPVRMIAPFAPGGGTDISARILAEGLTKVIGQTVVVDNRPGAGSTLGTDLAAKATPDGYTLLLGNISMAFNAALYRKLPYDTLRDFTPVSLVTDQPNILVAHPSLPAKTIAEFIKLARAQPGKLTYGSAGNGSGTHLAMELLLMSQQMDLVHVPFKGTGPALTALLGNQISVFFSTYASALPHVKADRLRAYAVTSEKRTVTLPDVPTVAETVVPGYRYSTWYGLLAPAGVPRPIIDTLSKATVTVLKTPEIRERYASQGMDAVPTTPKEFSELIRSEMAKWAKVVKAAKIPLL